MPIIETKGVVSSQGYGQFARSAAVSGTYIEDVFSTTLYTGNGSAQSVPNGIALGTGATSAGWIGSLGGSASDVGTSVSVDSSGNVYVCGYSNASGTNDFLIAKYNTSGVIQWQRSLGGSGSDFGTSVSVDSSGNVYVCGYSTASGTNDFLIAKYNTSGAIQWQRNLGGGVNDVGISVSVDSSGNVYVCGYSNASGTNDFIIAKYNTSGAIQWQRRLGGSGGDLGYSVAVDTSGNVYVCGYSNASGTYDFIIAKYNTSGVIQWQRSLGGSGSDFGYSVAVDSSGNVYVCGYSDASGTDNFIVAKLPGDGSGTGAYNVGGATFVYAPSTLTDAVSTLTDAASTLTDAASTLTDAASTLTDSVATLNSSIIPLAQGAGLGGLVWLKGRSTTSDHALYDTTRGATADLVSNSTAAQTTQAQGLTGFLGSGFSIGSLAKLNTSAEIYAAWTFAKQPKFFDIVTYTGNGASSQIVSHSLGVAPACIIIKKTSAAQNWRVYTRRNDTVWTSLYLNLTNAGADFNYSSISPALTSTTIDFGYISSYIEGGNNDNGATYVAYLFAHDAGGFGASGTDNVISCGSYTGNGSSTGPVVTLGYEPQWVLIKNVSAAQNWYLVDAMRGMVVNDADDVLYPNTSNAEAQTVILRPTATGFQIDTPGSPNQSGNTFIYIAIRRGPMRTPTLGTSVFMPTVYTGTNVNNRLVNTSVAPDMVWMRQRNDTVLTGMVVGDRLRGPLYLLTGSTAAEVFSATALDQQLVSAVEYGNAFSAMNGVWVGTDATAKLNVNTTASNHIAEAFRRAPGFFDVVCYTGTGVARTVNHNLGVVPELIIIFARGGGGLNPVYASSIIGTNIGGAGRATPYITFDNAAGGLDSSFWSTTPPTATTFSVGDSGSTNGSGANYVAYLFASCPGVSKAGKYVGTGSTIQVNCGFTAGARFVLIKRADAVGSWYVWDSARGIIAANDPYLVLNTTAAEVTNTDWVDTLTTGFEVSNAGSNLVNVNGGTYIFLAIA